MTMTHAIRIERTGGPEVLQWQDVNLSDPGPGEVRVRHGAIGVNFIDVYHRTGLYPLQLPAGIGLEAAGTVEAVGDGVDHLKPGDRVAYCNGPTGAYAQARVMPARVLVKLPDDIAFDTAAAMMLKGLTAQFLLRRTRKLQAGDVALFHAAAGGVGLIAGQWARALGVKLIGTAGSDEKCQLALKNGYAHCINYRTEDLVSRVKELTDDKGVAVVYDSVGRDTWERSLACLQPFGLMVSFGNASGPVPPVTLTDLAAKGSLYVTRPTLMTHIADRATLEQMAQELFDMVRSGQVKPLIGQRFALRDAAQAHAALEARATTGSIVLLP
ncbi:quinone oxidoreductase, NADPH-dependent [Thiomonas delicata]|jgi:NADPH2:quinone reductase|uniref:Quinone oxidoreductase, NADPH-dependent n=2 Tax=Burkholderiales genera incertae sedis TaxID=224471 RepID=A0A238D507_THIDL|nr:quinone oxidoreductase, NADPH-dependent [Thiomonas delicata]